jgi:PKD repeat protein
MKILYSLKTNRGIPFALFFFLYFGQLGYAQYCNSSFSNVTFEHITNVNFAGINNSSAGNTGGPVNYTAQTANVAAGSSYPLSVTIDPDMDDYIYAFFDWNQNNVLNDPGEVFVVASAVGTAGPHTVSVNVPATATPGNTRMRVMVIWANSTPNPCISSTFGEAEDYTVSVSSGPCAAPASGGTISASVSTVCPSVNFSITGTGISFGTGTAYQWQSSPDGFSWTNVAGQTGSSFSGSQTAALNYRLRVICTNGPDTAYSNSVFVNVNNFLNCYCASGATDPDDSRIDRVQIGTIDNLTNTVCGTYSDFTSIQTDLVKGLSYPITVTAGTCGGTFTRNGKVYIDFNQNGLFTDLGEEVYAFGPTSSGQAVQPFNGSVNIPASATNGITRMRVVLRETSDPTLVSPCGTFTWGETEDYFVNILPPPADEAGVLAITQPEIAACNLGNQLWVNMQNLGTNDLVSAVFNVAVNGFNLPAANWSGLVAAQSTAEVQVPVTYSFADGDSISVTVSQPNGVAENPLFNFNNQKGRRVFAGLSGIKTVYGTGSDYSDIDAAVAALVQRGACDTVYFKIATDTFTTQHVFLPYPGSGPGNLAVFEAATGNAADAVFMFNATTDPGNYVFRFDGADGYMLRNVTAINQGTAFSRVIDIRNGSDFITLEDNVLIGDTLSGYNINDFNHIVIASVNATNDMNTVVRNNTVIGGNRGLTLGSATGNYENGILLEGNTFQKFSVLGALIGGQNGAIVRNNTFRPRTTQTQDAFGVYITGNIGGGTVEVNDYLSFRTGAGIFLNNAKGGSSSLFVRNNFLYMGDTLAAGVSRGILIQEANSSDIVTVNNSISFHSDNSNSGAITVIDGSGIQIWNNNIGAFGTAPAVRIEKLYSVTASDNNNYFGTNLMWRLGNVYTTLANLQAATGTDGSSVSANPGFNGTDLHTCAPELNGAAVSVPFVLFDFDGDPRSTTPDIGADEFVGDAGGLLAEDAFLKCPDETVTLGNSALAGVTYSWTPSGTTSEISVTAAGTYVVTATSACGSFSDTAVVTNKPLPTANFSVASVGLAAIFTNNSVGGTSYLWDFGDGATSTEVNPTHVYASAATYSASLTVTNECGSQTFGPLPVNVINVSVEENTAASVAMFPNPTAGMFTLSLGASASTDLTVTVSDITGKAVLSGTLAAGTNQVTLDASALSSGIYSVKVSGGEFSRVLRLVRK